MNLKRRHIDTAVNVDGLPKVNANHNTLVQVFMNLFINSMHAMKENGRLEITGKVNGRKCRDHRPRYRSWHTQRKF